MFDIPCVNVGLYYWLVHRMKTYVNVLWNKGITSIHDWYLVLPGIKKSTDGRKLRYANFKAHTMVPAKQQLKIGETCYTSSPTSSLALTLASSEE